MHLQPIIDRARDEVRAIMDRDGIPGACVAFVDGGQSAWLEAFGQTRADGGHAVDTQTLFSVQSTSKAITATAVMIAVQRGLLNLDTPITRYLPAFTIASRHEDEPQEKMTLRLLLSHRAGFTHEAPVGRNFEADLAPYENPSFEAHVESISRTWLRFPVGRRYAYSNLGFDLAGHIMAQACAMSFADTLKALLFDPLGMTKTSADPNVYAAQLNRAIGHQPGFEAVPVRVPMQAAGGVYSAATDMARFAAFMLGRGTLDGTQILRRELWEEMHRLSFAGYPYALGTARFTLDLESGPVALFGHNGAGFGFGSCFFYCPERQLAWSVLFNQLLGPGSPPPFDKVALRPALEAALGKPRPRRAHAEAVVTPEPASLAPYVGSYVAGVEELSMELDKGALCYRLAGEPQLNRLAFTGPDTAYVAEGPASPQRVRLHPPVGLEPARIEFEMREFDFNDRADDPRGRVGDAYDDKLGDYSVIQWGVRAFTASLSKRNGYLYLGAYRLTEHLPGLLFTADGEAVDLRGAAPTFRNILLHRVG